MSPEAIAGARPDVGFDLWGLAVTLYESVAGCNPFVAADRLETARLISTGTLPDIRSLRPDCPPSFAEFLHRSLSINRMERPRTAREFGARLRATRIAA
jgi:serine/threonine protein kinase